MQFYDQSHAMMDLRKNKYFHKLKTIILTTMYPKFDMQEFPLLIIDQKKLKHVAVLLNQISLKVL